MKLIESDNAKSYISVDETPYGGKDAEYYHLKHKIGEKASKGVAGTALGFGIAGTALSLLNGGLGLGGVFGQKNSCSVPAGALATTMAFNAGVSANDQFIERKECEDMMAITNGMWQLAYSGQNARFNDRQTINSEMFGLYKSQVDGDFGLYKTQITADFNLYKSQRDADDKIREEFNSKFNYLDKELAVLKATRPYQDALIQCDINGVAKDAAYNLERRTCRMIEGEVVLPNTPVVSGYQSARCCYRQPASTTPAA